MRKVAQKLVPSLLLPILFFSTVTAQTLFTCGGQPISKEDFLKAYNKNNTAGRATTASYKDYLELYIRYKLKVRAAYDLHLDTVPSQRSELQNFRAQVMESYMHDEESMNRLVNEAFSRGQHDIHLGYIFIPIPKNATPSDTLSAWQKAMSAWNDLKNKKGFAETALAWSGDPAVRTNKGDIGYVTVFTLPYELENQAYSTPPGQFSKPFRSRAGYLIFKNLGERKSLGRIKVAQILLSVAPGAGEETRKAIQLRADSIYESLLKGADFTQIAKANSGDNLSFQNGGELPVFGVGRYDSTFENAAFSLTRDGEIGKPVYSAFGYHIIKRINRQPFPTVLNKETDASIRQQVSGDSRIEVSRKALLTRILRLAGYRAGAYNPADLWAFTDSAGVNKALSSYHNLDYQTILFSFSKQQYNLKQWLDFIQTLRNSRNNLTGRAHQELMDQFTRNMAMEYYRGHLEDFNKDFAFQLNEFREGNLLFEIMQRKIWDKASTDSAGLRNYYETHNKYWWSASADAILFTCNNQKTADQMKTALSAAAPAANWKKLAESAGAGVQADSGRFELSQIPVPATQKIGFEPGMVTPLTPNVADNTVSFAYILNVYPEKSPRNYKDARGFVINDYQVSLEDQWIADLKKKYPVQVDEKVFASLPK